ncbi:MAG TPA: hypothetical protein VL118_01420, partial [Luteimonas sp.]|nr:hypothetical protein [Luteimonas sp.]
MERIGGRGRKNALEVLSIAVLPPRAALPGAMLLGAVLLAATGAARAQAQPAQDAEVQPALTATTVQSGLARAPEQEAVVFEHADLRFKVDPAQRRIDGDATLTFRATKPLQHLVVDLDHNYAVTSVSVDGKAVAAGAWSNPEGRMTVALPEPLAAGGRAALRIVYGGKPHVAKNAPWDGGFVWATAPTGEPWVASAIEGELYDLSIKYQQNKFSGILKMDGKEYDLKKLAGIYLRMMDNYFLPEMRNKVFNYIGESAANKSIVIHKQLLDWTEIAGCRI